MPVLPPVYGSVVEAAKLCRLTVDDRFACCFADSLKKAATEYV